jgi:indole-3-pyruvate monooxygenase
VKRHSSLPFSPWPRATPRYPSRDEVVQYLERYVEAQRIAPRFGVEVRRVARDTDHFVVETGAGRLTPRFVVVATGYNGVAVRPEFPGLATFAGTVVHSGSYKNARPYVAKRTLVVGCGNSGAEIALDLAEQGVDVAMVVRGPVHVVPRDVVGRPSQETSIMLSRLPVAVRDALVAPVLRMAVGDLSRWGIVRPAVGPNRLIEETGRIPILDVGTIAQVKAGWIRVVPGIEEVLTDRVRFADGRTEAFDAIILATGYRPGLERFIDGFASASDERGRPRRFGEETEVSGLFFVGFRNPATGALREIAREAPRVAAAIRAQARG